MNDFNRFGRTWKVKVQAEPVFRLAPQNIQNTYVRTQTGSMVPLSTLATVRASVGPDMLQRYNLLRAAEVSGAAAPGYSSGQALQAMEEVAQATLPQGFGYEWTGTAFQEKAASGAQALIFGLALVLVFLWEVQTKEFLLQTRKHYPRWNKYEVDASAATSVIAYPILNESTIQEHLITGDRNTKRRLVVLSNGTRYSTRISGTGYVEIYAIESE